MSSLERGTSDGLQDWEGRGDSSDNVYVRSPAKGPYRGGYGHSDHVRQQVVCLLLHLIARLGHVLITESAENLSAGFPWFCIGLLAVAGVSGCCWR